MPVRSLLIFLGAFPLSLSVLPSTAAGWSDDCGAYQGQLRLTTIACRSSHRRRFVGERNGDYYTNAAYLSEDIIGLPTGMMPNSSYTSGSWMPPIQRNRRMPPPDYSSFVHSRKRSNYDLYAERQRNIQASIDGLNSQMKRGISNIQLTPVGTNLYVRNYVNYGGSEEVQQQPIPELKAVAKRL